MNIGEFIYTKRKELGLTLEEVGDAVGVSKSTVKKWETGFISNMKRDKIALLANILNVNPADFINEDISDLPLEPYNAPLPSNIFKIKLKRFPLLGDIACGVPIYADEDSEHYVMADSEINADFCLRAKGDSMINARILDGDIVFIKTQPIVENGEIAAVIIDDEATLKRVFYDRENSKLVLSAENASFLPMVYVGDELEQIRILGKAVFFTSLVK